MPIPKDLSNINKEKLIKQRAKLELFSLFLSVTKIPMQKATTNFIFGILVGLVVTFLGFAYMTGSNFRPTIRVPVRSDNVGHVVAPAAPSPGKSVLTHEDLEKIQQIIQPVQFKDEHHHHGK